MHIDKLSLFSSGIDIQRSAVNEKLGGKFVGGNEAGLRFL